MFADIDPDTPWWVAGIMSAIGLGYAVIRLISYYKREALKWKGEQNNHDTEKRIAVTEEQAEARKVAVMESVPVVERLLHEISELTKRNEELEDECKKCEIERAEEQLARVRERTVLSILLAWSKTQKNPPPIPEEMLTEMTDSRSHPKLGSGS